MSDPLVAGQPITISGLSTGTYLNGQVLTVLSSSLSPTAFEANFTHADVAMTYDAGFATPSTAFAYAINDEEYIPPIGQQIAYAPFLGPGNGLKTAGGMCFGSDFAPFSMAAWLTGVSGVNGCPFGGGTITSTSSGFGAPTLPPGAVIQGIYPVAKATVNYGFSVSNVNFVANYPSGSYSFSLSNIFDVGPNLGTDLSVLGSITFSMSTASTLEQGVGTAATWTADVEFFGVAVVYTAASSIPATQLQALVASAFGFSVESGAVSGVQVNFNAGMQTGSAASLAVQLTLGGAPVGTPKFITVGSWATGYTLGSGSDLWGLSSLTGSQVNDPNGIGIIISGTLPDGSQINLNDLSITITAPPLTVADFLDATEYGFDLTSPITGLAGSVTGFGAHPFQSATLSVQLLINGIPTGQVKPFTLTGSTTTVPFGGPLDTWGLGGLTDAELNSATFGLRFTLVSGTEANLQNAQLTAWIAPVPANFDYVTTFEDNFGNIFTLALDSNGDFWIENVLGDPGVFTPLFGGVPDNSFASSFTADSRQFIAISDLLQGNYPPQSYGQYRDRVSQVGPGAPPSFTGTLQSGANASITSYSASGSTLTLMAVNSFTAGEVVTINAGPSDPLYAINGLTFNVLGTGLLGTQFEISTSAISGSGSSTATATGQYTYPITSITQNPASSNQFIEMLWSAGPGSVNPGNVITIYYSQTEDPVLTAAIQNGYYPVYVYMSGLEFAAANGTFLVTGIGAGTPVNEQGTWYYFTYSITESGYGFNRQGTPGTYQLTVATLTSALPLPGVETGDSLTVTGVSPSSWNNTWQIVVSLNSGAYDISQTAMSASGVATYTWALAGSNENAPLVGQLVTVTGTLNGNGIFNVTDAAIATVTGVTSGTFTISGFPPAAISSAAEVGQATTSGTEFQIDPGPLSLGNPASDPIYGDGTGGYVTLVGSSSVVITPGTRKGTVFFITRNGFWTAPAPPVQFDISENSNYILISNIPIGPPNVIARAIVLTEAGQNGQPGGSYYTIPAPVQFVYNNITYVSSSFIINDNATTTAKLTFTDSVLLNAEEVDIQGNDLFNLQEIGDAAWCAQYHGRSVWGRVNNKIQNFLNLSFDGGYNPNSTNLLPLGWGSDLSTMPAGSAPTLLVSPVFGDAYYIKNGGLALGIIDTAMASGTATYTYTGPDPAPGDTVTVTGTTNGSGVFNVTNATIATVDTSAGTFTVTGLSGTFAIQVEAGSAAVNAGVIAALGRITQSAYQDYNNVAILQPQIAYSVRVTVRTPSGATTGALVIDLTDQNGQEYGSTYGSFVLETSAMTTSMATYTGTLLTTPFLSVPADLALRVWAQNLAYGGDIEIDRIDIFPTIDPINLTGLTISYKNDWESFDGVTGGNDTNTVNAQPANGAFVIHDQLYIVKEGSLGYLSDTPNQEPANWNPFREVSNVAGAAGINAYDVGEEWAIMACQNGLYAFNGGAPVPIHEEILEIWRAINWRYGHTICVRNDVANRHILISVPMATPNQWCPDFPVNSNPTSPNVVLCLDYKGIETIEELMQGAPMHITMMGQLAVHDLRRKWSLWSITSPYMAICKRSELFGEMLVCSGLGDAALSAFTNLFKGADNGIPFTHSYCTYGFVDEKKAEANPMLGQWNKRFAWWDAILRGIGTASVTFFQNILQAPYPWTVPGGVALTDPAPNDLSGPLNEYAMRLFIEVKMKGLNTNFSFCRMRLAANPDPWQPIR